MAKLRLQQSWLPGWKVCYGADQKQQSFSHFNSSGTEHGKMRKHGP